MVEKRKPGTAGERMEDAEGAVPTKSPAPRSPRVLGGMQAPNARQASANAWRRGGSRIENASIYFVQAQTLGLIKIGLSGDIISRLSALQTGSPDKLTLLGTMETDRAWDLEGEIHAKFSHLRQHGEWFSPGDDLLAFIERSAAPSAIMPWKAILDHGEINADDLDTYSSDPEDDLIIKMAIHGAIRAKRRGELIGVAPLRAVIDAFRPSDRNLGLQGFSDYSAELRDLAISIRSGPVPVKRHRRLAKSGATPSKRYQRHIGAA